MSQTQGWAIPPEIEREMTPAVRAFVERLLRVIAAQQARIAELEARVEQLEAQLRAAQGGGSGVQRGGSGGKRPPSPGLPAVPSKPPSPRKAGGQPGHARHQRPLLPSEACDAVQALKPKACRRCGKPLEGSDPEPWRHQVWELPEIRLQVTEYQRHRLRCGGCGTRTCAALPAGVPPGQSGPRLTAFVTLLMASFRQSKRRVAWFLETLLGVPCSPGLVVKLQKVATAAVRPCYAELVEALPQQAAVHADETPTRERNRNAWLWTVVAATFTVFAVRLTKAATVIQELLREPFAGVVTSDRAKMYLWLERLQWCWAHLKRDFEAMSAAPGKAGKVGRRLLHLTHELFHHWHRARDGLLAPRGLKRHLNRLYGQVHLALEEGTFCAHAATAATCQGLLERYEALWVFKDTPGVQPTNNAAERALRHGVIWKRLSFGTQSAAGSRFVETLLSVLETCRQQNRNPFAFLTTALQRFFAHNQAPTLLTGV